MNFSFKQKLQAIAITLLIVVSAESFFVLKGENTIRHSSENLINREMAILNNAHQLKLSVVQVQQWLTDISATRALDGLNDGFDEAENNARIFHTLIEKLKLLDPEHSDQYDAMIPVFENYISVGKQMAQAYIDKGPAGGNKMMANFDEAAASMSEQVDGFLEKAIQGVQEEGQSELEAVDNLKTITIIATTALFITVLLAFFQGRSLLIYLGHDPETLKTVAEKIAQGDLSAHAEENKAIGVFLSLAIMRQHLQKQLQEINQQAKENGRIKTALDNVTSPVIMLDDEEKIIYLNFSAEQLFIGSESHFKQSVSGFDASNILSTTAQSLFSQDKNFLSSVIAKQSSAQSELNFGNNHIRVTSTPVKNDEGLVLGTAIEMQNRTAEIAIEKEISSIVDSAQQGDLSQRISEIDKTGFFYDLAVGMNSLMDQMDEVFGALANVLSHMANGDFSQSLEGNYQGTFSSIQTDVNNTLTKLSEVINQLRISVSSMQDASAFIANNNDQLSEGAQRQAASLEQTASTMEQITSSVKTNADNADSANNLTMETASIADKGESIVQQAIDSMTKINESSNKISEIIGVIDEIAFQTNLLALNASVEAARAGEQGRGFAVVATEVRNLAGRSATAAKEIKTLIEDSVVKVDTGTGLVNKSGEALGNIVGKIEEIERLISGIARANREQFSGISDVNGSITSLDNLTQKNASLAEKVASTSDEMKGLASDAHSIMEFFK